MSKYSNYITFKLPAKTIFSRKKVFMVTEKSNKFKGSNYSQK